MSKLSFSLELAKQLYGASEQFPIDFDDAWQWMEFSTKGNAKRSFLKAGFVEGIDFCSFISNEKRGVGATQIEVIKLTCECFKQWGMMAGTEKGKQIRFYFIECERLAKSAAIQEPQTTAEMLLIFARQAVEQERRTKELEAKLALIEAARDEAIAALDELEEPAVEVEELTTRAKLNRLVRDYAAANAVHFPEVWRRIYREFRDRYHVDLKQRAKNIQAHGGKRFTSLDICEHLGKIEELYAVAFELLKV